MDAIEPLWDDGEFVLSRKVSGERSATVLLTVPSLAQPQLGTIQQLEHFYSLRDQLNPAWAARPLAFSQSQGRPTLVLEDPGGEPLIRSLGVAMEPLPFLNVAVALTNAVSRLHDGGLIHKDLKPANILVNAATGRVTLTGFGVASRLPRERQAPQPPESIAGTLAYMAPEQTGRVNRSVDSRSDLYAIGVTFYQMLTGALPFNATSPIEWVHCHVARNPRSPSEIVHRIPVALSAVVMKLLAKRPEERYQTAAGVEADLRRCLEQLQDVGCIEPFPLGTRDVPSRLLIPERLYGRELESRAVLEAFEQVVADGKVRLVLVSGPAGIGKSSIVNELHKSLVPSGALFASGKFDQYKRGIPYATLAQAFQAVIRQILGQPEDEVARWRSAIEKALGENAQLVTNLIPELEFVIGAQPGIAEIPPQDAQRRFQTVLRRFLGVIARAEHPLVLFVDDLQWLDEATLVFLEQVAMEAELHHLLVICAYRDNEVGPTHPLRRTLEAIRQSDALAREIVLKPLDSVDLGQLVADSLRCGLEAALALAGLLHEKTAGNPLFAVQFLSALADEESLVFDSASGAWTWDVGRIWAKRATENVSDLMIDKLNRLPLETLDALKQLACLGSTVPVAMLTTALGMPEEAIHARFWDAVRAGLIFRLEGTYVFLHDRVQEAAYRLLTDGERAAVHLALGRRLATQTQPEKIEDVVFDVVSQLTRGAELIRTPEERERFAELELVAGRRARATTAYASALVHLANGEALLSEQHWETHYRLKFHLALYRAECEFLSGELHVAEERLARLRERAVGRGDRSAVACLRMALYTTLDRTDRAVEVGLEQLSAFDVTLSPHPSDGDVREEYVRLRQRLAERPIETLIDLPQMSDPDLLAIMEVLLEMLPAATFTDGNLRDLALTRMTNLSLEHGNCDASTMAYAQMSMVPGPRFGAHSDGYRFGNLGLVLSERGKFTGRRGKVYTVVACFVFPWTRSLKDASLLMRRALDLAQESGDLIFAAFSESHLVCFHLGSGDRLEEVQAEAERNLASARRAGFGLLECCFLGQLHLIHSLRGIENSESEGGSANRAALEQRLEDDRSLAIAACFYWIRKLQACFHRGDYAGALQMQMKAEPLLWTCPTFFEFAEYHFYSGLAHAAAYDGTSVEKQALHLAALAGHQKQLAKWAETCPENFADRTALVDAEIARIEQRPLDAQRLYEVAIRSAREHGFVHNEGLANELAARFYAERGFETIANAYLQNARYCYLRWGADAKVQEIDRTHPHLSAAAETINATTTIDMKVGELELETDQKLSQAVSSELVLDKLIRTLMSIAIEHAGAERGLLMLAHDGELRVDAEATSSPNGVSVTLGSTAVTQEVLPVSVLRYVVRTQDSLILKDASSESQFVTDPYIQHNHARSVMCLPLVKQTRQIGVLYLENNLAQGVFTSSRIARLKLIASQASISLENARLYADLRQTQAYLEQAQRLSVTGSFGWKPSSGEGTWSEETYRIFRVDRTTKPTLGVLLARTHPEDRARMQELIERATRDAEDWNLEHRLLMPDGTVKLLHVVAHALCDEATGESEYVGAVMDVTEQERMTREIRQREAELRDILDHAPQHVAMIGADGRRLYANRVALDYAGVTLEQFQSPEYDKLIHPEDLERITREAPIGGNQEYEFETRIRGKDGTYRWFLVRFFPLRDADGQVLRWYSTGTEIHERKEAEERVQKENLALREEIDKTSMFEEIVGASPALQAVVSRVTRVAPTDSTVLITGETGTGKELFARAIHKRSARSARAFVSVNCAGIPQSLIASELFGHEKGAFTGALQRRLGRFELAEGGTLFLDEVGELPAETQIVLLRVLQEREFERVGGNQVVRTDVRLIAATNRDLQAAVAEGAFRSDLFYRLNVFPIETPPLRDRQDDIAMLVEYFIASYARKTGKKIKRIENNTLELLKSYAWPGNIRELQNVIERSVILCETETFSIDEHWLSGKAPATQAAPAALNEKLTSDETARIERALAETKGRVSGPSGAAAKLGIPASTLESKIKALKIDKHRFKWFQS